MRRLAGVVFAAVLSVSSADAQQPVPIIVFGTVRDGSGVAVARAELWIDGTDRHAVTNDSGEYRIDGAPSGHAKIVVRRVGYRPDSKRVSLQAGDTKEVKFVLDALLDELEAVLITAKAGSEGRMREFWTRSQTGPGVFITREDIVRRHPGRVSDLFRMVMGVRVVDDASSTWPRLVTTRHASPTRNGGAQGCPMQFYMDGLPIAARGFSVDMMTPDDIEAIEIFRGPSEIPASFRQRDTGCGVVSIWTREPPPRPKPEP